MLKILVVSENEDVLFISHRFLNKPEHEITACNKYTNAVDLCNLNPPYDIAFVEMMPPFQHCIKMVENLLTMGIKVVAVSSYGDQDMRDMLMAKGVSSCIFDGYTKEAYEDALAKVFQMPG